MCGIAGVLTSASGSREPLERTAGAMADSLAYRGPDDHGLWSDPEAGIALAHRRLSIVDLSPAGHQPMISADGRFIVTFNGEIYNFQELRPELEARGITFRGHSDTEVMLEAFAAVRHRGDREAPDRHVHHRHLGSPRADADVGARPSRHQAAVLGKVRRPLPVRFRAQGLARAPGLDAAHRPRRGRRFPAAQLHPGAALDLPRRQQARARLHSHPALGRRAAYRTLLGRARRRAARVSPIRCAPTTAS